MSGELSLTGRRQADGSTSAAGSWTTVAAKTGAGPWSGVDAAAEEVLPNGHVRVNITEPESGAK